MKDSLIAILLLSVCLPLVPIVRLYARVRHGEK